MTDQRDFTVLVVDDTARNLDLLAAVLRGPYSVRLADGGRRALELVESSVPDLILLDIVMPDLDGYEVCRRLKAQPETCEVPIIFLTGIVDPDSKTKGFELGAVDYITKPFDIREVRARVNTHLSLKRAQELLADQNATLERLVAERTRELSITQEVTIESLAILAETRDNETGGHIRRTQRYVRLFAQRLSKAPHYDRELSSANVELIYKSAPLHDIGKVGVPDQILLKPGRLTDEEFELMKRHTTIGRDALLRAESALGTNSFLRFAREIAYSHHERWDGSGYPQGLRGDQIPLAARIMALADVYDALISKRVYKPPFPHRSAIAALLDAIGTHFDPGFRDVVEEAQAAMWGIAVEFADSVEEREALGEP